MRRLPWWGVALACLTTSLAIAGVACRDSGSFATGKSLRQIALHPALLPHVSEETFDELAAAMRKGRPGQFMRDTTYRTERLLADALPGPGYREAWDAAMGAHTAPR